MRLISQNGCLHLIKKQTHRLVGKVGGKSRHRFAVVLEILVVPAYGRSCTRALRRRTCYFRIKSTSSKNALGFVDTPVFVVGLAAGRAFVGPGPAKAGARSFQLRRPAARQSHARQKSRAAPGAGPRRAGLHPLPALALGR